MKVEWSDFKVLLALSRACSVAGAARELQVDQSTISRRLAALEDSLGAKLLIRGGREFSWTAEGRATLESAEAMEAAVAAAVRTVRKTKVEVEGGVRVSVAPAFAHVLIRGLLPKLRAEHPELGVAIEGAFARVDLTKGEADIAVRMNRPTEPDLVARRAFDCGWFAYASQGYIDAHGKPDTHDALPQHSLVLYAELLHSAPPARWLETYKDKARVTSRYDSIETACQAAEADAGIAVLPAFVADPSPMLRRVFPDAVSLNTGWVVYHDCVRDNTRVRVVVDALLDFFRCQEAVFAGCSDAGASLLENQTAPRIAD
jgi:DNA-binding transcriptional LysR family regulator